MPNPCFVWIPDSVAAKELEVKLFVFVAFLLEYFGFIVPVLAVFYIMLHTLCMLSTPFDSMLILGTMDHIQLQTINGLPFLLLALLLTSFTMFQLRELV